MQEQKYFTLHESFTMFYKGNAVKYFSMSILRNLLLYHFQISNTCLYYS